jgi:hypothetical protein
MDFMLNRGICGDIVRHIIMVYRPNGQELERGNEIMAQAHHIEHNATTGENAFLEDVPTQYMGKIAPRVFIITGERVEHCSPQAFEAEKFKARRFSFIGTLWTL